jgi:hypothetical protein
MARRRKKRRPAGRRRRRRLNPSAARRRREAERRAGQLSLPHMRSGARPSRALVRIERSLTTRPRHVPRGALVPPRRPYPRAAAQLAYARQYGLGAVPIRGLLGAMPSTVAATYASPAQLQFALGAAACLAGPPRSAPGRSASAARAAAAGGRPAAPLDRGPQAQAQARPAPQARPGRRGTDGAADAGRGDPGRPAAAPASRRRGGRRGATIKWCRRRAEGADSAGRAVAQPRDVHLRRRARRQPRRRRPEEGDGDGRELGRPRARRHPGRRPGGRARRPPRTPRPAGRRSSCPHARPAGRNTAHCWRPTRRRRGDSPSRGIAGLPAISGPHYSGKAPAAQALLRPRAGVEEAQEGGQEKCSCDPHGAGRSEDRRARPAQQPEEEHRWRTTTDGVAVTTPDSTSRASSSSW